MSASRAEDLGQLLIIGLEEDRWSSALEKQLQAIRPGGVLLTQRNLRTPETTTELLGKIAKTLDPPPFLALEEEGGAVDPLRSFFPPLPSPHIAAVKGLQMVERLGSLIGEALALLGFNTNFAPRLNLANPLVKPSLDAQCFSSDPRIVAQCGEAFITGLWRHKVLACGKHFPGLSYTESSIKCVLPLIGKPMAELWREDLMPFRQLLPRLAMVKLSYAAYKAYDSDYLIPASLSVNVLEGLLRVKLNYRGVALVDPFESIREKVMGLFASPVGDEGIMVFMGGDAVPKSISIGCDILVVGFHGGFFELAADSLKKAIVNGSLSTQRVRDALSRIARAKKGLRIPTGKFSKKAFDRLCREFEEFAKDCKSAERDIV